MLVVDLYLDPDCGILLIDAAVVDAAFSVAEKLLKVCFSDYLVI